MGEHSTPLPQPGSRRDTPFGTGIALGRWAGVPIRAHWSVLLTLALFADLLATSELPAARPHQSQAAYWLIGSVTAVALLVTLLAHELAHAVTARRCRMKVQRITLWALGGQTELDGEPPSPRADALITAAGPLTSLGIGILCGYLAWWLGTASLPVAALAWLAAVNVLLGVFNLLPGSPLDGGRLLRALLWWRSHDRASATVKAAAAGRVLGSVLVGLGLLELLAGGWDGLWLALVGWFIVTGAASERYAVRAERLQGLTVRDVMSVPAVLPDWWTVQQFLAQLAPGQAAQPVFPLVEFDGTVSGLITMRDLGRVPPAQRATTRLRDVAGRAKPLLVGPDTPLPELLLSLHLRGGAAVVVEGGHPVGVVTEAELARAVELAELGWSATRTPAA
ncbi:MAG TPA: site-2 protease family protein [Jatrophihabitans sp.]|nr:site-2 protease family protein [Jatrophihabitans sp.]